MGEGKNKQGIKSAKISDIRIVSGEKIRFFGRQNSFLRQPALTNNDFPFLLQPPQQDDDVRGPQEMGHHRAGGGPGASERHPRPGLRARVRLRRRIGETSYCQVS